MKDVCIVTGGAGAMGLCAAKRIGADGVKIILADLSEKGLDAGIKELASAGVEAEGFVIDVTDKAKATELAEFAALAGNVKGLINLAGISPKGGAADVLPWNMVFDIPTKGTMYISKAVAEVMKDGGCILNISSTSPFLSPPGSMSEELYPLAVEDFDEFVEKMHVELEGKKDLQTSKNCGYVNARNFIIWFTEHYACQVGKEGIRVVAIGPGVVDGPMVEESGLGLAKMSSLGRTGRPEEMAEVFAFVMSDKASYLTGTNIMVDGGIVAGIRNRKR